MSKLEKQKDKAKSLEAKDPKGAAEAWLQVLKEQDEDADPNPDLSIYNRIGDLYLKLKDPAEAADYYDQAVDKYAELGFHNNAIAMCNKVLRNAPGRQNTYFKLAKLYAAKGFMGEAKQNFLEYAERIQKAGMIQQAFTALKEFAEISAESAHLRELLEEHLRMYGDPDRRPASVSAAPAAPVKEDLSKSGRHKTSSLVFLDVDSPPVSKQAPAVRMPPRPAPPRAPEPEPEPAGDEAQPAVDGLIGTPEPEPDESLAIEATSLAEEAESPTPARPPPPPAAPAPGGGGGRGPPLPKFEPRRPEPKKVTPVVPKRPAAEPPKRKPVVEVPPLELETDFTPGADTGHAIDEEPLAMDDPGRGRGRGAAPAGGIEIDKNARAAPAGRRRERDVLGPHW